ncbi:MAG: pantoate--beta-alanine ligase [Verrucomicrobiota bacterium]
MNPTQFGPKEDFKKYPRPQKTDKRLFEEADVDVLFHPSTLYVKDDSTRVNEDVDIGFF